MANISVTIKPNKTTVSSVTIGPQANVSLSQLNNVDASDPDNNETLVYDSGVGKFVVKTLPIIQGGTF